MTTEIQPGQRREVVYGFRRFLECRCDQARLSVPLPSPLAGPGKGSFCKLCNIRKT